MATVRGAVWLSKELRRLKTVGHVLIDPFAVRVFQEFQGVDVEWPQVDYVVALAAHSEQIIDVLMTKIIVSQMVDLQTSPCPAPLAPTFSGSQDLRA